MDVLASARTIPTSPYQLIQRPLVMIHEDPVGDQDEDQQELIDSTSHEAGPSDGGRTLYFMFGQKRKLTNRQRIETFTRRAFFSTC
jgi:hypothetical protein